MQTTIPRLRSRSNLLKPGGLHSTRGRPGALMWPAPLLLLWLSACGQGMVYMVCPNQYAFGEVASEEPISCEAFEANSDLAANMLASAGIVPLASDHDFNRVSVMVQSGSVLEGTRTTDGSYDNTTEAITLSSDGRALLHEMLHHWQWIHGVLNTDDHPDWCQNKWGDADWNDCPGTLDEQFHAWALDVSSAGN